MAEGMAESVINEEMSARQTNQLKFLFDELTPHHGERLFGISQPHGLIPRIIVRQMLAAGSSLTLDFTDLGERARATVGGVSYYDVEIHLGDGRVLTTALEDAPTGSATFSVEDLPNWLQWK